MLKIQGHEGQLLNLGTIDLSSIDNSPVIVPVKTLFLYTTGHYPMLCEREQINCSTLRFVGTPIYQSKTLEDTILNKDINPVDDIRIFSLTADDAYLLVNESTNVAVASSSFYQICQFCDETEYLKINEFFKRQGQINAHNIHSDLLGQEFDPNSMHLELLDFNWSNSYMPTINAHALIETNEHVAFGTKVTGQLERLGTFEIIYVQNEEDIPENHIHNYAHAILDIKPTLITPIKLITNTVTTEDQLNLLIDRRKSLGMSMVAILSNTKAGVPIYLEYNFELDVINTLLLGYSKLALEDYIFFVKKEIIKVRTDLDSIQIEEKNRLESINQESTVQKHSPGGSTF